MEKRKFTRRQLIATASAGTLGVMADWHLHKFNAYGKDTGKLALLGGDPVRTAGWPEWPVWDPKAEAEIIEMLRSGRWWRGRGEYVAEFEKQYAELIGAKRCLATASGTTALLISMHVLGVDAGDEVLVSPFTFIATYNVIFMSKALPVFVDTDPETFLIDPGKIEEKITDRTSAIMPVHIYGLPVDMDRVNSIARKHNLKVVEDAAHALPTTYNGRLVGSLDTDATVYSFYATKTITTGEGGMIVTDDPQAADKMRALRNQGRAPGDTWLQHTHLKTVASGKNPSAVLAWLTLL